eukprot:2635652-Rhodomonas_salina.1
MSGMTLTSCRQPLNLVRLGLCGCPAGHGVTALLVLLLVLLVSTLYGVPGYPGTRGARGTQ